MWDAKLKPVLKLFFDVEQPLMNLVEADALNDSQRSSGG